MQEGLGRELRMKGENEKEGYGISFGFEGVDFGNMIGFGGMSLLCEIVSLGLSYLQGRLRAGVEGKVNSCQYILPKKRPLKYKWIFDSISRHL